MLVSIEYLILVIDRLLWKNTLDSLFSKPRWRALGCEKSMIATPSIMRDKQCCFLCSNCFLHWLTDKFSVGQVDWASVIIKIAQVQVPDAVVTLVLDGISVTPGSLPHFIYWDFIWFRGTWHSRFPVPPPPRDAGNFLSTTRISLKKVERRKSC